MSAVVLCSANGAPGVTTSAMALGWAWAGATGGRRAVVVDADPAGSGLLPGFAQAGLPTASGVLGLATRRSALDVDDVLAHCVALGTTGGLLVLPGFNDPAQARAAGPIWRALVEAMPDLDAARIDLVVDAGRLGHEHQPMPLLAETDVAAVVARPSLASVAGVVPVLGHLATSRGAGRVTTAMLVGQDRPYSAREVARELHLGKVVVLAEDRGAVSGLVGGSRGWRWERTALAASAARVVSTLLAMPEALVGSRP